MSNSPSTIRLSITKEVAEALGIAKKRYPTLSDPEILKLGLSKIVTEGTLSVSDKETRDEVRQTAAYAVGHDYLTDAEEDVYAQHAGKQVHFS
jgi:hypothetical protein